MLDGTPAVARVFNFTAGAETVTLTQPGDGGLGNKIGTNLSETISFNSPTGADGRRDGRHGSGHDLVQGLAGGFDADLTIAGGRRRRDVPDGRHEHRGGEPERVAASIAFLANFATSGNAVLMALAGSVTDNADDGAANVRPIT